MRIILRIPIFFTVYHSLFNILSNIFPFMAFSSIISTVVIFKITLYKLGMASASDVTYNLEIEA